MKKIGVAVPNETPQGISVLLFRTSPVTFPVPAAQEGLDSPLRPTVSFCHWTEGHLGDSGTITYLPHEQISQESVEFFSPAP